MQYDSAHPLHSGYRGPKRPTMKVPGIYAEDMNVTGQKSVRDCRLSNSAKPHVRVKAPIALTTGYVADSDVPTIKGGPVNKRHAKRRLARGTQRRK